MKRGRLEAYSIYFSLIILLGFATIVSWVFFVFYDLNYFSIAFGGFLTGLTGVSAVAARDLQKRKRLPRVFIHSWKNLKIFNSHSGEYTFPIIVRNKGLEPGQNLMCLLRIKCINGSIRMGSEEWEEATTSNLTSTNEMVFQRRLLGKLVYPLSLETVIGELIIKSGSDGNFEIELQGNVFEKSGFTSRICKFIRTSPENINVLCEPEKDFKPYY